MHSEGFNAKKEIVHIVSDIKHYFATNAGPNTKAVIGISGGKDSTIAAALLVKALGPERVIGVRMPNDRQCDIDDAIAVCDVLGIPSYTINIGDTYNHLVASFIDATGLPMNNQIETNTPARLRMTTLYMVAAAVGGRVINTGNASEAFVGYTTKYGDLAGDYAVLRDYYVSEIYEIGGELAVEMNIPQHLILKDPADGMSGKTDEDNLGFAYKELDDYLTKGIVPAADVLKKILDRNKLAQHKLAAINLPHPRSFTRPYVRNVNNYASEDSWSF